ncbi:hypothetical protein [Phorcysia thermohydrogeniphila]|uniref:Uncharacterized protein n=1 Tax=Phorcysia thermohydrogeniphila TaxID=936138 RepID=A0A4R1G8P1_9BACT|nr:hypothetical protein [Phorcysia thermohydrogeniphila]TCK04477.1 hypothetical protein CLV27_0905 [Phorcysia thermohydrogeniphila]
MVRRIGKLSLVTLFALGLFSCGGGGGGGGGTETSSTSEIPPYPFVENEPNVEEVQPQQADIAYFTAEKGSQALEVYFPKGITLPSSESGEEQETRALTDITPSGGPNEVKIAWNGQEVWITMQDPDTYDRNLFIAMELVGGTIDFTNQLVSAQYERSDGTGNITETYDYGFDVFNWFAVVPKDNTSDPNWQNKARLRLNFGTNLLAEGDSNIYWFGGWDLFGEGIKYQINVRANDLPDVSISANYDTDGDTTNNPECPIYVYTNSSGQKVIEFPTKNDAGANYVGTHCVAYSVVPGGDDTTDGEKVTLEVSKDGGSTYTLVLDQVSPDDTTYFNPDYKNKVNLNSNLSAGSWGDDIIFKVSQDVAINGTTSTVNDYKIYQFKTYGANDAVTVTVCVTADTSATSCTPHTSAPNTYADYYDIVDSSYKYKDETPDGYERYWHDLDNDNYVDENEPVLIVWEDSNGFRHVALPSTGGKVFYALDHNATNASDIHGIFHVKLKYSDDGGSTVNPHGEVVLNDGAIEGYVHAITLDSAPDDTSSATHFYVPQSSDNERSIYLYIYKDFSWPDNNETFESQIGVAPLIYFSLNTPTTSG